MPSGSFEFESLFAPDLPVPARRWPGFPEFNFVGGNNDADGVPVDALAAAAAAVLARSGRLLATYNLASGPQGHGPLREFVVHKVRAHAGIECTVDDILITSGSLQGIDLVNEVLLSPGDTVLAEQFTYGGALSRLKRRGVNVVGIPLDAQGLRTDALAQTLHSLEQRGVRPKYIYTIPTVQNPTNSIMGLERRLELLRLAGEYAVAVFEDECYADLIWSGERPPSLHALDETGLVIHIGSFSKSVAPALRVGYLIADWSVLSRLLACKTDAGSGALEQMVLAEFCAAQFDSHVSALNVRLEAKARTIVDALEEHFGTSAEFHMPGGGIYLWVKLPDAVDTQALSQPALAGGVAFNPGPEWSTDAEPARSSLRLCFANPDHDSLRAGVKRLAEICSLETGIPAHIANVPASARQP